MNFYDLEHLAPVAQGQWLQRGSQSAVPPIGFAIDTRSFMKQCAFVAIRGKNFDGHDFLSQAVECGASLIIIDDPLAELQDTKTPVLLVDDCRVALGRLAQRYRQTILNNCTVLAVTGSCGKTTTKAMIHSVLSQQFHGKAAPLSFNNDIGVPLTLLSADKSDEFLVCEIGTNRPGEIAALGSIARPDIAVITCVGPAHLEGFRSIDAILREKTSLLDHLVAGGAAVVHDTIDLPAQPACRNVRLIRFGCSSRADLQIIRREWTGEFQRFQLADGSEFSLRAPGSHNAENALAAIAVARLLGCDELAIHTGLRNADLPPMRFEARSVGGIRFVNDAYNANPQSMRASLSTFLEIADKRHRRVCVLGDMLELGLRSIPEHSELLQWILVQGDRPDLVVLVGELFSAACSEVTDGWQGATVSAYPELDDTTIERISSLFQDGDTVLVKASRSMELERIVRAGARSPVPG